MTKKNGKSKVEEEKEETVEESPQGEESVKKEEAVKEVKVAEFSGDFGREDLNALRDKVNEIIAFLNA